MNEGKSVVEAYAGSSEEEIPLGAYAGLMLAYCGVFGSALLFGSKDRSLRKGLSTRDIVLFGLATHRLSRIVTRDRVTAPLRMPFTRYEGKAGAGELDERPRGHGLRRALGNLLTCQFCAGPWIAAGLAIGVATRPRATRMVASVFSVVTVADFAHQLYAYARRLS